MSTPVFRKTSGRRKEMALKKSRGRDSKTASPRDWGRLLTIPYVEEDGNRNAEFSGKK